MLLLLELLPLLLLLLLYVSYRIIPDRGSEHSKIGAPSPFFFDLGPFFSLVWRSRSVFFASCEHFALELGPSDLDFARLDSPRDGLDVVFGSRTG